MIIDCGVYRGGKRLPDPARGFELAQIMSELQGEDFVWLGMHEPSDPRSSTTATGTSSR